METTTRTERRKPKSRVGILGGSFNPIHTGHLILAQSAVEALELSTVLFIPCAIPPHKSAASLIAAEHRLAMVQAAIEGDFRFEASDIEIARGGISYAVETVAQLYPIHPGAELCFIIGADTLRELHSWKDIYSLLRLCRFVTFSRPGTSLQEVTQDSLRLDPPWPERLIADVVAGRQIDISSSDIRHRAAEGMSIRYLVPEAVEMYIAEHRLYE